MKSTLLLFATVILLASCKKDIEELPPVSDTGANTFGLKLDGEMWIPQKFGVAPTAPILEARRNSTNDVYINARNFSKSPTETEFEIFIEDITGPGTFQLNQSTNNYPNASASYGYYIKRTFMPEGEWITGPDHTGSITISKFDTTNLIIAGTFEFTAKSINNTASPVIITEGRFDVKLSN